MFSIYARMPFLASVGLNACDVEDGGRAGGGKGEIISPQYFACPTFLSLFHLSFVFLRHFAAPFALI